MARAADFTVKTAKALAARSGYICSFPSCEASTVGPSAETNSSSANTGMACHIFAASDGPPARRVGHGRSIEELRSIDNGVWMCHNHGKLIDSDECTYSPQLLADWRRLAERKAKLRQKLGRDIIPQDISKESLSRTSIDLNSSNLERGVAEIVQISSLDAVWGHSNALAVRDLIIELGRNTLTHGKATYFQVTVAAHCIALTDDGTRFSISDLRSSGTGRGGSMALRMLHRKAPEVVVSYCRQDQSNKITLASTRALDEMLEHIPCSIKFGVSEDSKKKALEWIDISTQCETIFLRPAEGVLVFSDIYNWKEELEVRAKSGRDIALILEPHSDGIMEELASQMPNIRLILKQ